MTEFPREQRTPDASTLRRIALLVMRASQDDETLRAPMTEIWNVIDHLKKDVALGQPFRRDEVVRLESLLDRVAVKRSRGRLTIQTSILTELRDLGHTLCEHVRE